MVERTDSQVLAGIGLSTEFLLIVYAITNNLTSLACHIQGLSLTRGILAQSIAMPFITSQVRDIFKWKKQINPTTNVETVLEPKVVTHVTTIHDLKISTCMLIFS
ncbi:unnamed protein product [Rotaria socialis]|uniref:Uncharacterized protein n=1 Tax=Rotaria socialis TaxID=392032 RepID=A0A818ZJH2_9BILA|nr:unnamed protein product [Rotaria socialis]